QGAMGDSHGVVPAAGLIVLRLSLDFLQYVAGSLVWAAYNKAKGSAHTGEEAGAGSRTRSAAQWESFFDHDLRVPERIDDEYLVCGEANRKTFCNPPNWHRARIAHKECGWKGGDRGGLAERQRMQEITKRAEAALDSDRPSHGRHVAENIAAPH